MEIILYTVVATDGRKIFCETFSARSDAEGFIETLDKNDWPNADVTESVFHDSPAVYIKELDDGIEFKDAMSIEADYNTKIETYWSEIVYGGTEINVEARTLDELKSAYRHTLTELYKEHSAEDTELGETLRRDIHDTKDTDKSSDPRSVHRGTVAARTIRGKGRR
jgi:hypothetical protein